LSASTGLPAHPPATAGFGIRTLAYLVDALLLSFVGGAFPYLLINTATTAPSGNPGQQVTTSGGGSLLVSLIYFVLFWSSFGGGRTLGMRLFGLKVVREEDLGQMGCCPLLFAGLGCGCHSASAWSASYGSHWTRAIKAGTTRSQERSYSISDANRRHAATVEFA